MNRAVTTRYVLETGKILTCISMNRNFIRNFEEELLQDIDERIAFDKSLDGHLLGEITKDKVYIEYFEGNMDELGD